MPCFIRHFIIAIFLFCAGCGFQPRGSTPLSPPLQHLYLKSLDPYGKLSHNLQQYFKVTGVQLASTPQEASIVLDILKEETMQQLLSVSANQQTRQYNLVLSVTFQLTNPKGAVLVSPQTLTETRAFTIQSSQVLAGSNEANSMYQEMRHAMVFDIVNRLSSQEISAILMKPSQARP